MTACARSLLVAMVVVGCGGSSARTETTTASRPAPPVPHVADRDRLARETLRCTGTLDASRALAEVHRRQPAATDCYQDVLELDPSWRVSVRVDLVVERGGDVSYVSVGDVDRSDFAECLTHAMDGLTLPALSSGECAIVGVPYGFHTETR